MTAIAGMRGTGDWGTDERPKNFREMILWMNPNGNAPLTALSSKMKKETTDDPEFSWWEETLTILRLQVNDGDGMVAGDTTFIVDSGALSLVPGDVLLVEKSGSGQSASYANEVIRVTQVNSDTSFVAARGQAGSTAGVVADDTYLTKIGSVFEEGATSPGVSTNNPTKFYNYTQIFKTAYELTGTAMETKARTGDPMKNDKKRKSFAHARDMEMAWWFGKRYETTGATAGKPMRYTGGLMYFLSQHSAGTRITVKSSAYSDVETFLDDLNDVFDYTGDGATGGDERLVFCGNGALNAIGKAAVAAGTIQYGEIVKQWGMNLTRLTYPQGSVYFKTHPLFNVHSTFKNQMVAVDPPGLYYRPMKGRDTAPEDNIQAKDQDGKKGQWKTEAGLEFHHMETMKAIQNISYSAA